MYALMMTRDMQSEFTFMQKSETPKEEHFGKCGVITCEITNWSEGMDIDDMIIQHPYVSEWTLTYKGHYIFNK